VAGAFEFELPNEDDSRRLAVREWLASHPSPSGREFADAGYSAPHWPRPWGLSAQPMDQLIIEDELRRARVRPPALMNVSGWLGPIILTAGTDAQKARYLFPMLAGEERWCQLFSEPDAGSDLASVRTAAVRVEDTYIVNGHKIWTSEAHKAHFGILLARTGRATGADKHDGISLFICPMDLDGVSVMPIVDMSGSKTFSQVYLENVVLPAENLIGEEGRGWSLTTATLANERVTSSGGAGGVLFGQGPSVRRLIDTVVQAGGTRDALMRQRLAEVFIEAQLLRVIRGRVLATRVKGGAPGPEASVQKAIADVHGKKVMDLAMQLSGAGAMVRDGGPLQTRDRIWSQGFLFSPSLTIGAGTAEIQRNVIGERILGLPRDPELPDDGSTAH
jgi:alkylation response protein AidB-like acyl-CoA dehydrogenase